MTLHIQDPNSSESDYLVDALLDACATAQAGGGAFAFLSAGGVQLLLNDEEFTEFLGRGPFDLLVGVDAITDQAAIAAVEQVQQQRPNLNTRVYLPSHPRSIFHPKVAWFDQGDGGVLVTGSGNLTLGGLRWNIEAFSIEHLDAAAMAELRAQWTAYLHASAGCLKAPDSPEVVARLERNAARRKAMRDVGVTEPEAIAEAEAPAEPPAAPPPAVADGAAPVPPAAPAEEQPADAVPAVTPDTEVYVAQIPAAGSRWKQANFGKDDFYGFFGASETVQRRAYFFHVRADGTLGAQEVRPAVARQSKNYSFELDAASGLPYPTNGRPVGVFVKVATRTFPYMLVMPGDAGHAELTALLDANVNVPVGRMKRAVFTAGQVQAAWPTSPLWGPLTLNVDI